MTSPPYLTSCMHEWLGISVQMLCAYCLMDELCRREYPELSDYGVSIDPTDIRHLSVDDKQAEDACLAVAVYLHTNTKAGMEAFALRRGNATGAPTMELASRIAGRIERLDKILAQTRVADEERIRAHWQEIQQKKAAVEEYREALSEAERRIQSMESRLSRQQYSKDYYSGYQDAMRSLEMAKDELDKLKDGLDLYLQAPQPVYQPLPRDTNRAKTVSIQCSNVCHL